MRAITIAASGSIQEVEANGLQDLQDAVGGYIELVRLARDDIHLYVNEEGMIRQLPVNLKVSMELSAAYENGIQIFGDAILVGIDSSGDLTDLPDDVTVEAIENGTCWAG